ncbi:MULTISPECIES: caspase, EACC1-associated type [Streptomyces]|uniref:caspase, EACC1-associated type n=1 Tax=Streptomyces TaxID=1883 RepID=UPI00345C3F0C
MLIGTAAYQSLTAIPHSVGNVDVLCRILTNRELGGLAPHQVTSVLDPAASADIMQPLEAAAAEAEDALLVYYSGHGMLDDLSDDFLLSVTTSQKDKAWTSLRFPHLAEAVKQSRAATRIVILDCCFSARAFADLMADDSQVLKAQLTEKTGMYCLASSAETKTSKAPKGHDYSAFTGYLVHVLRNGIRGAGPALTMAEIGDEVCRLMRYTEYPIPVPCNRYSAGGFVLVPNRSYEAPAETVRDDVRVPPSQYVSAAFKDALRRILTAQKATVVFDDGSRTGKIGKLKTKGGIPDTEELVGYVKSRRILDGKPCLVAFTECGLYVQGSMNLLRVPYTTLDGLSHLTVYGKGAGGGTDLGSATPIEPLVTTTLTLAGRSTDFEDSARLIAKTLDAFLPAMADLRSRHPAGLGAGMR